jgi:hypothetical protein
MPVVHPNLVDLTDVDPLAPNTLIKDEMSIVEWGNDE